MVQHRMQGGPLKTTKVVLKELSVDISPIVPPKAVPLASKPAKSSKEKAAARVSKSRPVQSSKEDARSTMAVVSDSLKKASSEVKKIVSKERHVSKSKEGSVSKSRTSMSGQGIVIFIYFGSSCFNSLAF